MEASEGASSAVYLALFFVAIPVDRRSRRQQGAGVGLPGISVNASPVSPVLLSHSAGLFVLLQEGPKIT